MKIGAYAILAGAAFALSGCIPALMAVAPYVAKPKVLSGDQSGLTVQIYNGGQEAKAMTLAEEHCAKYGKVPKVISRNSDGARNAREIIFECNKR